MSLFSAFANPFAYSAASYFHPHHYDTLDPFHFGSSFSEPLYAAIPRRRLSPTIRLLGFYDPYDELERELVSLAEARAANRQTNRPDEKQVVAPDAQRGMSPALFDEEWLASYWRAPAVHVSEREKEFLMTVDLPGVAKGDIKLKLTQDGSRNVLTVTGERKEEHVEKDQSDQVRSSRSVFGRFCRTIYMPENCNTDIQAKHEDGVLKLTIPKVKPGFDLTRKKILEEVVQPQLLRHIHPQVRDALAHAQLQIALKKGAQAPLQHVTPAVHDALAPAKVLLEVKKGAQLNHVEPPNSGLSDAVRNAFLDEHPKVTQIPIL